MTHIIGGGKTGYNLYQYLKKENISNVEIFYFPGEYSEKKNIGKPFSEWKGIEGDNKTIISSETAFNHLSTKDKKELYVYYYIRNKENFENIANNIGARFIESLTLDTALFPLALKPKDAMEGKVPFKIKQINSGDELGRYLQYLPDCIMQPFLSEEEYCQMAVAGYFDGSTSSLIGVEQKNHYPRGISAFVVDKTSESQGIIKGVSDYLNTINYRGFIEFEFKKHRSTNEYYLMDINPRPWGWFYYYLDGIINFKDHIEKGESIQVRIKKMWVNLPRLVMANLKGKFKNPSLIDIIKGRICYEPYFKK